MYKQWRIRWKLNRWQFTFLIMKIQLNWPIMIKFIYICRAFFIKYVSAASTRVYTSVTQTPRNIPTQPPNSAMKFQTVYTYWLSSLLTVLGSSTIAWFLLNWKKAYGWSLLKKAYISSLSVYSRRSNLVLNHLSCCVKNWIENYLSCKLIFWQCILCIQL